MTDKPLALIAELTHRCPLRCLYCSNPLELTARQKELSTEEWLDVIQQAAALGVLQVHITGGEPLLRADLEQLVEFCSSSGLYTNLITSGLGLDPERATSLKTAGLNAVQLSIQSAEEDVSRAITKVDCLSAKKLAATNIAAVSLPLTVNVVLSQLNIDNLRELIELAVEFGAHRIELAHTQFHGWALANRSLLMPTLEQIEHCDELVTWASDKWKEIEFILVRPDYFEGRPKPCGGGWAQRLVVVSPEGKVFPCLGASALNTIEFENTRSRDLHYIWYRSESFNLFRGTEWMPEPCRSCDERFSDHGGCRCQAFQLTGSASVTDPACDLSPDHHLVTRHRTATHVASEVVRTIAL